MYSLLLLQVNKLSASGYTVFACLTDLLTDQELHFLSRPVFCSSEHAVILCVHAYVMTVFCCWYSVHVVLCLKCRICKH